MQGITMATHTNCIDHISDLLATLWHYTEVFLIYYTGLQLQGRPVTMRILHLLAKADGYCEQHHGSHGAAHNHAHDDNCQQLCNNRRTE